MDTRNGVSRAGLIGPLLIEYAVLSRILMLDDLGRLLRSSHLGVRSLQVLMPLKIFEAVVIEAAIVALGLSVILSVNQQSQN